MPVSALALATAARCLLLALNTAIVASRVTREFSSSSRLSATRAFDLAICAHAIVLHGILSAYALVGLIDRYAGFVLLDFIVGWIRKVIYCALTLTAYWP